MQKLAVLIIDDEEELGRLVGIQLSGMDVDVEVVYRPSQALELMKTREFQLVITDGRLPEMHGYELAQKINSAPNVSTTIFMMTGFNDHTEKEAKAAGIAKVYLKPAGLIALVNDTKIFFESCRK